MKKKFLPMAAFCTVLAAFTSCLNHDDDSLPVYYDYFTITQHGDGYVLYSDNDNVVVYPTATSVATVTAGKGFADNKRVELYMEYNPEYLTTEGEKKVLRNAELKGGNYIRTLSLKSRTEAEAENLCVDDSIFSIESLDRVWARNGYLNTKVTGCYSGNNKGGIRPTVNLMLEYDADVENAASIRLLYNRHSTKDCYTMGRTQFLTSYDASLLLEVPGSDSISLKVYTDSLNAKSLKIARKDLLHPAAPGTAEP